MRWIKPSLKRLALSAATCLSFVGMTLSSQQAEAHFPFRYHHWGWGHWGYRHFSPVSFSVYTYRPWLHRSYSVGYYSTPLFYYTYPTYYYVPTYYYSVPAISWPISTHYYQPSCASVWNSPASTFSTNNILSSNNADTILASHRNVGSRLSTQSAGPLFQAPLKDVGEDGTRFVSSIPNTATENSKSIRDHSGTRVVSKKPSIVEPYSPVWTKAAVGLVDDMIREGRFDDAVASCRSMEKISQSKGAGVYLRQAITSFFSQEADETAKWNKAISFLDHAFRAGAQLSTAEIPKGSLTEYLAPSSIDVSSAFESLSQRILENPESSMRELVLLSVMLKLDGQSTRSKLFASEAQSWVNANPRWQGLLNICLND